MSAGAGVAVEIVSGGGCARYDRGAGGKLKSTARVDDKDARVDPPGYC